MSEVFEEAFFFDCEGDGLPGIVAAPAHPATVGVLIVVGGPQYRVGSHRQFIQLARAFAASGVACMRFDCRGMGDADGDSRPYDAVEEDIRAAIVAFRGRVPAVRRIVLLGLCDGATAAALFGGNCESVAGLLLINPWVRTEEGASRTFLRHYYAPRMFNRAMWRKLAEGQLGVADSLRRMAREMRKTVSSVVASSFRPKARELPERMLDALMGFRCQTLILLSQHDFVAREFEGSMNKLQGFSRLLEKGAIELARVEGADHTFSGPNAGKLLIERSVAWLARIVEQE